MPRPAAVWVDLVLDGPPLRERLIEWRVTTYPPVPHDVIAEILTAECVEVADRKGREHPDPITQPMVWRWCHEFYRIEGKHKTKEPAA